MLMIKKLFSFGKNQPVPSARSRAQPAPLWNGPVELLITNATIVTCDEAFSVLENASLGVHDGKIVSLITNDEPAVKQLSSRATQIIDAENKILMPGLINTHCHAGDSLFRGLVEGLPLEPWLEKLWIAETGTLTPETIELGSTLGYAENALNGVTTVVDMFWEPDRLLAGAKAVGIRVATGGIYFDPPGIDGKTMSQRIPLSRQFFDEFGGDEFLLPTLCVHGAYTVGPEQIKGALQVRDDYDALITIHAAETRAEQKTIIDNYGKSVIRHLDALGLLSEKSLLAHCVHVDEGEIDILAKTGAGVAHNPASNLKLGSGIAPIPAMMKKGVRIGLGTDGAVSGNDLDMWNAIRLAATLHNGANEDALAVRARDAVRMATLEGAKALGIDRETGSLEIGKRADIILINPHKIHAVPSFDPVNTLAYTIAASDVQHVWSAGQSIVRDGAITTIDVETVLEKVNGLIPAIAATLAASQD